MLQSLYLSEQTLILKLEPIKWSILLAAEEGSVTVLWHSIEVVGGVAHEGHTLTLVALVSLHHAATSIVASKTVLCV